MRRLLIVALLLFGLAAPALTAAPAMPDACSECASAAWDAGNAAFRACINSCGPTCYNQCHAASVAAACSYMTNNMQCKDCREKTIICSMQ